MNAADLQAVISAPRTFRAMKAWPAASRQRLMRVLGKLALPEQQQYWKQLAGIGRVYAALSAILEYDMINRQSDDGRPGTAVYCPSMFGNLGCELAPRHRGKLHRSGSARWIDRQVGTHQPTPVPARLDADKIAKLKTQPISAAKETTGEPTKNKVWIYLYDEKKFKQLDKHDPKLKWGTGVPRLGEVVYCARKNAQECYVYYGDTPEEVARLVDRHISERIAALELQLVRLRRQFVAP